MAASQMFADLQRCQQRLRLGDFGHLRRRRKAIERGAENGVGLDGAMGGLVEFGERERGAQFEAAGLLGLRDRDGGEDRPLPRGRGQRGFA